MHLARKHTDLSFPEIGRFMGNKNHSTVILANRRIAKDLEDDKVVSRQTSAGAKEERLREIVARLEEQLGLAANRGDGRTDAHATDEPVMARPSFQSPILATGRHESSTSGVGDARIAVG